MWIRWIRIRILNTAFYGSHPLFDEVEIAEDERHVHEEEHEADHEQGDVRVHHVVNFIIVAEGEELF
jgi:hypothetical protein